VSFTIRNDGNPPLANDTRITITLPAGTISAEGLGEMRSLLYREGPADNRFYDLTYDMDTLGDQWQDKAGNYPKRLSRLAYKNHKLKLSQYILSEVGNIARDHSNPIDVTIDITRQLNLNASAFYHDDSCWWGSYAESRCALKTSGGFGLRTFDEGNYVNGRAWVMPLRTDPNGRLTPTFNTETPSAFVVFNGYGKLAGYAAPRILSYMTGWTYRKISFSCEPMFVNGDSGYLVAPEAITSAYNDRSLTLSVARHSDLFAREGDVVHVS
jgi:hypothetical protein